MVWAWSSDVGKPSTIYWVKVDSSGPLEHVQKVSIHPDNILSKDSGFSQIAIDSSGNSYIVWSGWDGHDYEIYWVKVDSSETMGPVKKDFYPSKQYRI